MNPPMTSVRVFEPMLSSTVSPSSMPGDTRSGSGTYTSPSAGGWGSSTNEAPSAERRRQDTPSPHALYSTLDEGFLSTLSPWLS